MVIFKINHELKIEIKQKNYLIGTVISERMQ